MRQRQPFLPFFDYWISENGGRIHGSVAVSSGDGVELSEITEWTEFLDADKISKNALESFNTALEALELSDVNIDRKGYYSMIRIKASQESLEKIVDMIPSSLKYTSNLGYLDVQLRRSGKLQAVHWLLSRIEKRRNEDGYTGELPPFIFMGDDDNDVEIARESTHSLIAKPCSAGNCPFNSLLIDPSYKVSFLISINSYERIYTECEIWTNTEIEGSQPSWYSRHCRDFRVCYQHIELSRW